MDRIIRQYGNDAKDLKMGDIFKVSEIYTVEGRTVATLKLQRPIDRLDFSEEKLADKALLLEQGGTI